MITQQGFPSITAPFADKNTGVINQTWLQLLISLWNRTGQGKGGEPNPVVTIEMSATPFIYTATEYGHIWIDPGTYTDVTIQRGETVLSYGKVTRGIFPMSVGDTITLIFTDLPPVVHYI